MVCLNTIEDIAWVALVGRRKKNSRTHFFTAMRCKCLVETLAADLCAMKRLECSDCSLCAG